MKIAILAVGSEARYQPTFDTAYQYLKKESAAFSSEFSYTICRPETTELFTAMRQTMSQNEAVVLLLSPEPAAVSAALRVVCGGLERTVSTDAALQKQLEARAARMGVSLSYEQLADFASFPSGATLLPNAQGLVQGYAIGARRQLLLVLPALPGELSALYPSAVRPLLGKLSGLAVSYGTVRVLELDQFSVPQELARLGQNPHLKLTSRHQSGDYEISVEATGATQSEADDYLQRAIGHMQQTFGIYLYCIGNRPLPQIAVDGLTRHGLTLATAEWGTDGLLSRQLSAVIGANDCYRASYNDTHIGQELSLPHRLLQEPAENAALIAGLLAQQSRRAGHTALGLGVFCQAGAGQLHVALADKNRVWHRRLSVAEPRREDTAQIAVWQAMNVLRLYAAQYPKQFPGGIDAAELEKRAGLGALFARNARPAKPENTTGKEPKPAMENKPRKSRPAAAPSAEAVKGTNLIQRIKMKALTKNDKIRIAALALCVVVFAASLIYILGNKMQSVNNGKLSDELANLYDPDADNISEADKDGYPSNYISGFEALYKRNPDIAGWVKIPDTKLDYAVMQAEDNDKYHRTDIDLNKNDWGIPYVDFRVDQEKPSYNTVIYGHNMNDGTMFGYLQSYKKLSYYQQHPLISYNSVYRKDMYKIFAIVVCKADDPDFDYHNFIDSDDDAAKNEYIEKIMERSIIKTTVDVKASDRLLTLSTCDYTFRDPDTNKLIARLVVFSRAVRDGESETVNVNAATLNPNPLMPKQWYEYIKKQQEKKAAAELEKEQKAYIALWLTETEAADTSLTTAELYAKAQERAALAERCLTAEELSAEDRTPEKIKQLIEYRQKLFVMLLTQEEEEQNTASKKLALCQERLDILQQEVTYEGEKVPLFKDTVLFASKWSQLQPRYKLLAKEKKTWKLYLSVKDVRDLEKIDGEKLQKLFEENQKKAKKYLTEEQIAQYETWEKLSEAVTKAEATRKALEAEGLAAGLTQSEMDKLSLADLKKAVDKKKNQGEINKTIEAIKVLNPSATGSNGTALTDMTLDELKNLLATLQQERAALEASAKAAGMTNDEIKNLPSNTALQKAIEEKTKAQREALIKEILAIEGHPAESELQGKTLDELKALKEQLTQQAAQRSTLISEIKALAAELGESVDDAALNAMTFDQLTAKKQELQNKKTEKQKETQRQADLAAIRALDPAAADSVQNSDAASVTSKLNEVRAIRSSLEATAAGLGINPADYPTNAALEQAIRDKQAQSASTDPATP